METLEHGTVDLVQRPGGRRCQQRLRAPGVSGQQLVGRGLERPPGPPPRVGGERRRALQKGGSRCQPAPRARPPGRLLQLARDVLVGPDGGVSAMPCMAIGIELGIGGGSERPVRGSARLGRCRAIDRRAQERVAKYDLQAELQQPVRLRGS